MAGVLGIFGLIIAVVIATNIQPFSLGSGTYSDYSLFSGVAHLRSGLTVGLTSLSCGIFIGIAGDAGNSLCCRGAAAQARSCHQVLRRHGAHPGLRVGAGYVRLLDNCVTQIN